MTTPPTAPAALESLRFALAGRIAAWDPTDRRVQIGPGDFWVASGVSVSGVVPGVHVTVLGHVEPPDPRWIITTLMLDRT